MRNGSAVSGLSVPAGERQLCSVCAGVCVQVSAASVHAACAVSLRVERPPPPAPAGVLPSLAAAVECVCGEAGRGGAAGDEGEGAASPPALTRGRGEEEQARAIRVREAQRSCARWGEGEAAWMDIN